MTAAPRRAPLLDAGGVAGNVSGIGWPAVPGAAAAALIAQVEGFERSQWWAPEVLAAGQRRQLASLLAHHAAYSAGFAARLAAAGLRVEDLTEPGGLQRLPTSDRRALQGPVEQVYARGVPEGHLPVRTASTSGSTGEPVRIRRTAIGQHDWQAMVMRTHLWHTPGPGLRFAAVRPNVAQAGELVDWGEPSRLFFPSGALRVMANTRPIAQSLAELRRFRPDILLSFPSTLGGMIDEEPEGPSFPLKQVRTIGETIDPALRSRIAAHWDCPVVDCYSSEEVGHIAIACPDGPGSYHAMDELLIVEILDEAGDPVPPGAEGRVVLTDLRNFATALIRYDIGDRAVAGGPCECGRGLSTIARVLGRTRNLILMPDGSRHWPLTGRERFRDVAPVRQFQLVQRESGGIVARMAVDAPLSGAQEAALRAILQEALGYPFVIRIEAQQAPLPRGPGGKFEEFVNQMG